MSHSVVSILPPIIAIVLALTTKEVYVSLVIAILSGAIIFTGGNILTSIITMFSIMGEKIGGNVNILIFLAILGILVAAIAKSGATRSYGDWARAKIKGKRSALGLTALLGMLIFIDDYFNCLTVGTVMRPVTDKFKIARAKLAYVIDATAAPICIIAPVSSWAAAVSSSLPEDSSIDGFSLFLQTIPFNFYALLTLVFLAFMIYTGRDFATMGEVVKNNSEHFMVADEYREDTLRASEGGNGKIIDLVLPLVVLISSCIYGMLYTGGIHEGKSVADAFADCDASQSLVLGSFIALVFTMILYLPRAVVTFEEFCSAFSQGFKAMTPAIFILCLAWTLSGICSDQYLDLGGYVKEIVSANTSVIAFLPAIFFIVAIILAFATGTSWGTFGILIPIAVSSLDASVSSPMLVICVAAILSGAVGGDHASPISDTTILASAGSQCNHLEHVATQVPYVIVVSICCFFGFLSAGVTESGWVGLGTGGLCLVAAMFGIVAKFKAIDRE